MLATLCAVAHAQQIPNDIDLRAAYCLPIVNEQVAVFGQPSGTPQPPQAERAIKDMASDAQGRLDHLKRYLLPRMPYLDATALAAAAAQGKDDSQRAQQDSAQCLASCERDANPKQCLTSCETDTLVKVRRCTKLGWLPF